LNHHRARLKEDHANAKALATGLSAIKGLEINPSDVETNMVRFRVLAMPAQQLVDKLKALGVLVFAVAPDTIRAVTSLEVTADDIGAAVDSVRSVLR
jgi:threonine aldolase